MKYSDDQMKRCYDTNIIDYANSLELPLKNVDKNTVKVVGYGGLFLFKHGRGFSCMSTGEKGDIVTFAMKMNSGFSKMDAIGHIIGEQPSQPYTAPYYTKPRQPEMTVHSENPETKADKADFVRPAKDKTFGHMFAYLEKKRGISPKVLQHFVNEKSLYQAYESYNGKHFSYCAFVGKDIEGNDRYTFLRSTMSDNKFRKDAAGSDKRYGFSHVGESEKLYIFESPIDLLSHCTLYEKKGIDWEKDHLLSCGGVSDKALAMYLDMHPQIKELHICFDQDEAGETAADTIGKLYGSNLKVYRMRFGDGVKDKDLNEHLKSVTAMIGGREQVPVRISTPAIHHIPELEPG